MHALIKHPKRTFICVVLVSVLAAGGYLYHRLHQPLFSPEVMANKRASAAAQDEMAVAKPALQPQQKPRPNKYRNVYFGDLHVHSRLSFDSYIFGNRLSVDEAYRFAKGEALKNPVGEVMQLTRPLDFAAITDHAEGFDLYSSCRDSERTQTTAEVCQKFDVPIGQFFLELRDEGAKRPMQRMNIGVSREKRNQMISQTWTHIVDTAHKHNQPGRFTSFAAYEYSPVLPGRGKIHRNIIFRNQHVPAAAISAYDADTEIDLWRQLQAGCASPCEAMSIPHNPNRSWGLAFAGVTLDGDIYQPTDWASRAKLEPLVEMFQIKGNSECAVGMNTKDEACGFEQFLPICEGEAVVGQTSACVHATSMARDGLKKGLTLQKKLGFNPLAFGMIGSTDTHNSNPGDVENWDYRGPAGAISAPAKVRIEGAARLLRQNPGGLAAVWARENTRDALFAAMQRKEVYATSGTRLKLRFYGSSQDLRPVLKNADPLPLVEALAVPMGGKFGTQKRQPQFMVWALRDALSAPLDKVQIIKSWLQDGDVQEAIYDVACSGGRVADAKTGQCPPVKAHVDVGTCEGNHAGGAGELKAVWQDAKAIPGEVAFYYARVIETPSCRWSSYDALRLGKAPPKDVPASSTEMAWSSPIWVNQD